MLKPAFGNSGKGICIAFKKDDKYFIKEKNSLLPLSNFNIDEKYIMQEIVQQADAMSEISRNSLNTVRTVTLLCKNGKSILTSASVRFGVGNAFVDNWSAGGIAVGINRESGKLNGNAFDKYGKVYYSHPDSGKIFEGFQIPYWQEIIDFSNKIQEYFQFYKMLGLDIAISKNGLILIEVNPSTDIIFQEQTAGPLFADKAVWKEFKEYNLLVNKYQKKLYI